MGSFRNIMPGFGAPADTTPPTDLDYDMWLGPAPKRPYNPKRSLYHFRWFWDYSGGQMTNLGAHEIDVVQWAMQVKGPAAVYSSGGRFALEDNGETPDTQDALFEYPGFTSVFSYREAALGHRGEGILEFFGTKGSMSIDRGGFEVHPDMKIDPANAIPVFTGHPAGGPKHSSAPPEPEISPTRWLAHHRSSSICTRATFSIASNRASGPSLMSSRGTRSLPPATLPTSHCVPGGRSDGIRRLRRLSVTPRRRNGWSGRIASPGMTCCGVSIYDAQRTLDRRGGGCCYALVCGTAHEHGHCDNIVMTARPIHDTYEFLNTVTARRGGIQASLASLDGAYSKRARAGELGMYIEVMIELPKQDASASSAAAAAKMGAVCLRTGALGGRRYEDFSNLADWQALSRAARPRSIARCRLSRAPKCRCRREP
jgi:hypothetical protein